MGNTPRLIALGSREGCAVRPGVQHKTPPLPPEFRTPYSDASHREVDSTRTRDPLQFVPRTNCIWYTPPVPPRCGKGPASVPTKPPEVQIVVDDRERSPGVLAALRTFDGVELRVARLDIGDYAVGPNLVVERKTVSDFVQSVIDGRLFRQARRLSRFSSGLRFLVLEGADGDLRQRGLSQHAVHGALITLNLVFGLPVLRTLDPVETAHLLVIAGRQLRRRMTSLARLHPSVNAPSRSTQLRMLPAIRDIGPLRASALLEHFGSIRSISAATLDELVVVPGIGQRTAHRIHWAMTHRDSPLSMASKSVYNKRRI